MLHHMTVSGVVDDERGLQDELAAASGSADEVPTLVGS